jgi:hypothetical protein
MQMKTYIYKSLLPLCAAALLTTTGCIEESIPTDSVTPDQVASMTSSQESMVSGLASFMVTYNTYQAPTSYDWLNDWGYPCQMFFRDVQTADFAVGSGYNYWSNVETNAQVSWACWYTYNYYYALIRNADNLINVINPETAGETSTHYLGIGLTFRALAYLDLARMYEYKATGYETLDAQATANKLYGLTVPIVTEKTTAAEAKNNPRAPFYTMYRFIMTDLNNAETYLNGYKRTDNFMPNQSAVYGLKARLYLEMATRFNNSSSDLSQQLAAEGSEDGYDDLGITSALDCYRKASEYAEKVIGAFSPVTEAQWKDPSTGFNTPNQAWVWSASLTSKEQFYNYWDTFLCMINSEADWSMAGYNQSRGIGSWLYKQMTADDWRRDSWIAPEDEGVYPIPAKYQSSASQSAWTKLPAYANLKFRAGSGNLTDYNVGLLGSVPLMRVEEMYLINAECMAYTQGASAAAAYLESFVNTYRTTGNSYMCVATTPDEVIDDILIQKRIEFWGEGLTYFDLKRLSKAVTRSKNDNYLDAYLLDTKEGYVAPWMNYYILPTEVNTNPAIVNNPDASGVVSVTVR